MTCPELDPSEFGQRLRESLGGRRVPLSGKIELTARCNLDCVHCFINEPANCGQQRSRELTYAQWCDLLDQVTAEGCLYILLTGGEPLLRPDFIDIYDHAKRKGLVITLFTNGTLVTPEVAKHLREWPPHLIEITLYGATRDTYESVTGVEGSFERCMRGIRLIHRAGLPLQLKTVVMKPNRHEFEAMEAFAQDLGLEFRYDGILRPRPDGSKEPGDLRLSPDEVVELDLAHPDLVEQWKLQTERVQGTLGPGPLYVCGAGVNSFHIDSYGCLSLCIAVPEPCLSLVDGIAFREGWQGFLADVRRTPCSTDYACRQCELVTLCSLCPAFALYEVGDAEAPVEYRCEIAKRRAIAFGLDEILA